MVQQPEALNKYYLNLFVKTLEANLPTYEKTQKRYMTPSSKSEILVSDAAGGILIGQTGIGQYSDYVHFRGELSLEEADPEIEGVVRLLASKLGATVETLVRHTAIQGTPSCFDLFKLSDGTPNLRTLYCVKGNEATVDDPTGSITGWFAYRVRFAIEVAQRSRAQQ